LADAGEQLDRELHDLVVATRGTIPSTPEFAVWMASSLDWARFAQRDDDFIAAASKFFASGNLAALTRAEEFPDRFGSERLREALIAFRNWFEAMDKPLSTVQPNALKLKVLQERSLQVALRLKEAGQLKQIGMWLFPSPFKIMVIAHKQLWTDAQLPSVLMPAGTQVERALRRLVADKVIKLEEEILQGGDGTFGDTATSLWALQIPQGELAVAAKSNVLHINSALYLLGHASV